MGDDVDRWTGQTTGKRRVAIIRSHVRAVYLAIDLDGDGKYSEEEIREMRPTEPEKDTYTLDWDFPDPSGTFTSVPISFRVSGANRNPEEPLILSVDDRVLATGEFPFYGRPVRVAFLCFPEQPRVIDLKRNRLGLDTNGDGQVDWSDMSEETAVSQGRWASKSPDSTLPDPVLRVGNRYVSFVSVDVAHKTFIVRERSRADYLRIELAVGGAIPDFAFIDFSGRPRHFGEFRGKYVLLDFWGSWCVPCVRDLPRLQEIYARLHDRGFEVLGIDNDEESKAAEKVIEKFGCAWTNARTDKDLFNDRFMITSWPTKILVNPQGTIVSLGGEGEPSLAVEDLERTLAALPGFPARAPR
jgi:thiol-disulfide isomerase/thioredoxin